MAKKIYCLAEMAFQYRLSELIDLRGGGERVLADTLTLLKELGYEVHLYQFSYEKATAKFRGHKVHGLGNIPETGDPLSGFQKGLESFYEEAKDADGIYLLSMNLSAYTAKIPTITVSHGIMFNHCEHVQGFQPVYYLDAFKKWIRNSTHTISCDTDTLHLMSVYCPQVIKKMTYVPNYVDLTQFTPKEKLDDGIFRILYPRRLQHARGYHIMMQASDILLEKYKNIEIIFAGKGNKMETDDLHNWMIGKEDRVKHIVYEPEDMPKAYENVSVGIVPTCYSEGTSLSNLELLASKVLPISTWVGGLSDLVQPYVNGLIIPPNNSEELVKAIEYVMNNPEHVSEMRENGQRMIKHFGKERWDKQITEIFEKVYGRANE
jgi:glycosyltransferase involved in cell wall biosynthesis